MRSYWSRGSPSSNTIDGFTERENLDPEPHAGRHYRTSRWRDPSINQKMPKTSRNLPEAVGKAWNRFSLTVLRRNQSCQLPHLGWPATRTVRHWISVVQAAQFVVLGMAALAKGYTRDGKGMRWQESAPPRALWSTTFPSALVQIQINICLVLDTHTGPLSSAFKPILIDTRDKVQTPYHDILCPSGFGPCLFSALPLLIPQNSVI